MGRRAIPVELQKSHLTKAEIEARKKAEIKIGEQNFTPPTFIKRDKVAYKRWKELVELYKNVEWVSNADVEMMARYCQCHSEYIGLVNERRKLAVTYVDVDELGELQFDEKIERKILAKIDFLTSVDGLLKLDKAINAKVDTITKLEDRMFLNPLARLKNIPKREKKEETPAALKGFDDV